MELEQVTGKIEVDAQRTARTSVSVDFVRHLHQQELWLQRRYGIRLRFDKLAANGHYMLCTCSKTTRWFLRAVPPDHEIIEQAYTAVKDIHLIGLQPMISVMHDGPGHSFPLIEGNDPFQLRSALHAAGLAHLLADPAAEGMPPTGREISAARPGSPSLA